MIWYFLGVSLHIVAAFLWIGHMIYWTMVAEPIAKRFGSSETGRLLREASNRLDRIGWPCLGLTVITGIFLLFHQGVTLREVSLGHLFLGRFGKALGAKLVLVGVMFIFQFFVSPNQKVVRWLLLLMGITLIPLSALLVR